ncbi:MAG: helix-turn-helix domain-containing protein [Schwartzia sp. (in: firmicutes)]
MDTGKRLRTLREERGLSQEEVANAIGVSRVAYLKYESGENRPVRKLKELSRFFNVTTDYLLGNDTEAGYYVDPETARIANEMKENPGCRVLFDASRKLSPESLKEVQRYVEYIYQKQEGNYDD